MQGSRSMFAVQPSPHAASQSRSPQEFALPVSEPGVPRGVTHTPPPVQLLAVSVFAYRGDVNNSY